MNDKFEIFRANVQLEEESMKHEVKATVLDVLKTPNLRRSTLILYFTWFVNSFVYYGISLNIGDFGGGNLFLSFFIAGLIEFPSYLFCVVAFKYIGRRPLTAIMMYGSGLACLACIPFTSSDYTSWRMSIAMIGKFCITSSYGLIYVYAAEIYPTVVRQAGVGSCSIAARVGSIIAPYVKELVSFHDSVILILYYA
jgi:OCT family organic cation transporter-like MFS transporter 4/5